MNAKILYLRRRDGIAEAALRIACGTPWLHRWVFGQQPTLPQRPTLTRLPRLEIVSHCWGYAHLAAYQLWSLVQHERLATDLIYTLYYSREDRDTASLVDYFDQQQVAGLQWQFIELPKPWLMRRAIGRHQAALATQADWLWFTDCDVVFGSESVNRLATVLQHETAPLVYPALEYRSLPLPAEHPWLSDRRAWSHRRSVDAKAFVATPITRATGPLQIVRGDVARGYGYCPRPRLLQKPALSWCKATEDRVFRWQLGTSGKALDVGPFYRIQHQHKGRYGQRSWWRKTRELVQQWHMRGRAS